MAADQEPIAFSDSSLPDGLNTLGNCLHSILAARQVDFELIEAELACTMFEFESAMRRALPRELNGAHLERIRWPTKLCIVAATRPLGEANKPKFRFASRGEKFGAKVAGALLRSYYTLAMMDGVVLADGLLNQAGVPEPSWPPIETSVQLKERLEEEFAKCPPPDEYLATISPVLRRAVSRIAARYAGTQANLDGRIAEDRLPTYNLVIGMGFLFGMIERYVLAPNEEIAKGS